MKTRQAFISNSSSTSFFLPISKWDNTKTLTWYLIENRFEYYTDCSHQEAKYLQQANNTRKRLQQILQNHDPNDNFAFMSVNFDTYVTTATVLLPKDFKFFSVGVDEVCFDEDDQPCLQYFYVRTCNNVTWEVDRITPPGLHHGDIYDGLYDHDYVEGNDFFFLDEQRRITVNDMYECIGKM